MKKKKTGQKKPGKRKVKNEVKITLWLLFISAALLVVFSLWGNLIDPISKGLTGAVIGTQDEVNTTNNNTANNSSSDGNITLLPENNTAPINESNNASDVGNTNNNSDTNNTNTPNNTSNENTVANESTTSNESNGSIGSNSILPTLGLLSQFTTTNDIGIKSGNPPNISSLMLNTSNHGLNDTNVNLTAYAVVTDPESDAVKVIYNWLRNGTSTSMFILPFEGGSNSSHTRDYSGNGNNGSVIGAVWNSTAGYDGKGAYEFNGTSDRRISFNPAASNNPSGSFSITVWVKLNQIGIEHNIIEKNQPLVAGDEPGYWVQVAANNSILFGYEDAVNANKQVGSRATLADGNFHFIAVTYEDGANRSSIYFDGILNVSDSFSTRIGVINDAITIGARNNSLPDTFDRELNGVIDDLVVYNRSLTADQILALYQNLTNFTNSNEVFANEVWVVEGTPNDGTSDGAMVTSNSVAIAAETTCGYVNGDITLINNINASASCFVVNASNIVIDGAGFMVNGTSSSSAHGVNVTGFNNVTIKNLNIHQFSINYFMARSQNSTIFNSSGINASDDNVQLLNVYGLNFTNNTINNATNQLIQLTSVNQSMFQNNRLVITDDIAMLFNQPVSKNNNITGNNISFIGDQTSSSAIEMGTSTASNNINIYNNTFHMTRARAGVLSGYNGSVINNTFYIGLKGEVQGNTYAIDPTSNGFMLYQGNTILGFAQRSNGIGSGAGGTNNTYRENFLNLSGSLSEGFSFTTNVGSDNHFESNIVILNNTNGPGLIISSSSATDHYVVVNNTFINPNKGYQVQVVGSPTNYFFLNNTYAVINFTSSVSTTVTPVALQWWVKVNITAPNGTVITGANVTAYNLSGGIEQTISTDAQGLVKFNLTETFRNGSIERTIFNTPHNITATAAGYLINFTAVNLTTTNSTQINLILEVNDTTSPSVTINTPTNNSNLSSSFVINATVTDDSSLSSVQFRYENDSTNGSYVSLSQTGSYWNSTFDVSTVSDGNYTIRVNATDASGNRNSTVTRYVIIDRVKPDVQGFNTPTERQNFTTGNTIIFNASISKGIGSNIHAVRFQLENGTNGLVNVTPSATNDSLYNFSITIGSGIDEGNRTVTIFTNDTSGNMNNSVSTTFVVDRTAPQTPILNEPTAGSTQTSSTVRFNWTSTDALSPTMYCNLTINSVVNQTNIETANGTRTNISLSGLADGSYSWNVTCADAVRLSNASATQSFTIDTSTPSSPTTGGGGGGGSSGGGAAAAAPSAPSSETATPTRSPERATQTFATPTEVQQLLREQRFTISVVPKAVAEVAREERPTALQTALTGRAIGPPPERPVERRSLVNVRRVSVTFVNDGDKAIRIAPAVKDRSPIKLVDERRAEELVEERIRAALPTTLAQTPEERERIRTETEIVRKDIEVIQKIDDQLREIETIKEVREILRLTIDEEKTRSDEVERLEREIDEARNVEEAKEKIKIILELEKTKQQKLVQQIKTDEEIRREVEETVETLKKVEEERVQFISTTKALAPQKGLFFLPNVDGSVSYSGGHTSGKLLKTEIINPEETTVGAKQTVTKEFDVRLPISLTAKPVTLSFTTEGEEILTKEVDVTEKVRVGTALSIDLAQSIIDAYILIPKYDKNSAKSEKKYLLEFNINERQSFFFPSSRYSEIFGPYQIGQDTIFAQELSYDSEAYKGILPVSLKIYEEGELIAENDYTVNFGSGDVKEGFDLSLLTGFAVTGRAVFAGLNQNTQKYSTYLVDALLLILLAFFLIVGTAYLHRMAVGVVPHKPIAGAVPRRKVTMMPKNIRSIFFEKELSHLNQRLSSLEGEEISALLWQDGQRMKKALERKEKVSPKVFPTILKQSERYQMLDKELLKVQNAIENVEKTEVQKTKIRTLLSSYRPTTAYPSERKTAIDKELEKITTTLARAERKPNSLLERLFPLINRKDEKDARKAMREVLRISRKVEGKNHRPSNELLEIEQRLGELDRITEKKVKMRRDIPPRSEMGKLTIKEMIKLQNEKAIIEQRLSGIGERNDINRINILKTGIRPTKELSDIERRLANVDTESEKVKRRVLINVPSVNVYERDNSVTHALREQRPRQKRELKRSPELEEIEKAILDVEKPFPLKTNVRTIIPDRREVKHTAAVEELKRLSEEYREVDSVIKRDGEGTLRKRRIAMPAPSPELLKVEKRIAEVDTIIPQKMKIKTEITPFNYEHEQKGERKEAIDKELEEITRTLEQGEKRPASLLERLFSKGKSASEKKKEREAVREVARISRKVEGKNRKPANELIDVEKKLEKLKRELREK